MTKVYLLRVFSAGTGGGNPLPVVLDAKDMSNAEMQAVATKHGHESGFVFPAPDSHCDYEFRFWTPGHEMEMCGHATLGISWLMARLGMISENLRILTKSGIVNVQVQAYGETIWIDVSQPKYKVMEHVEKSDHVDAIMSVLGISKDDLAPGLHIQNAATSRVKTLIPLKSVRLLNALQPDFPRVKELCHMIGSTGLYPYAISNLALQRYEARQFPQNVGYPEDAATGIAASALAFGLLVNGSVRDMDGNIKVRQGTAMGKPSEISVRFNKSGDDVDGCWIGGTAMFQTDTKTV
jgi:PhzF family phenazine biosynthesis protein